MTQIIASKMSRSGRVTMSSTKRWTTENVASPTRRTQPACLDAALHGGAVG